MTRLVSNADGIDGRDVRQGGTWTPRQRLKNDALWLLATGAFSATGHLSRPVLRALGATVGAFTWALLARERRIATANVARALPELDEAARRRLVRRAYLALGKNLGDAVWSLAPSRRAPPLPFAPGARDVLDAALRERRGVVFASAHLGPWESVAATLACAGLPLTVVAREPYDPRLTRLYERLRGGQGVRVVFRGAPGAATTMLRALRAGGMLGIPMDIASRVPSVDVPLLGSLARTPWPPRRRS